MPLDVIMPALGMAQETGQIVAWHKHPGDAVAKGDVLFEVETDKATMEVEAQGDGFLTDVAANEGEDVPVGQLIAKISQSAQLAAPTTSDTPTTDTSAEDLPKGNEVIMPTLGMAQDTGLLVSWHKAPGDPVTADEVLFEVETDKSTVEVNAGHDGFVAALLAEEGQEVPTGHPIAVISANAPDSPFQRKAAPPSVAEPPVQRKFADTQELPTTAPTAIELPVESGKILASPKARRLARDQGLDLAQLVDAGYPQPFHVKDLETLRSLPANATTSTVLAASPSASYLTAEIATEGFTAFATWAGEYAKLTDSAAILAGFCAASLNTDTVVAVEYLGNTQNFDAKAQLTSTVPSDAPPQLLLRDLRFGPITSVQIGGAEIPTLTMTSLGSGLAISLEFSQGKLDATAAIALISNFAGRMEQPLRHLL